MKKTSTLRAAAAITLIVLLMAALPMSTALADTTTNNFPGTGANVTGVGTIAWTNPGNITADDTAYATATNVPSNGGHTNYLRGTNFGFAIPAGATINGITVRINRQSSGFLSPFLRDNIVRLVKAGAIVGSNLAVTAAEWPTSLETATYGSATNLWGTTWTAAEINDANFGVVLSARNANTNFNRTATVDFIQVTVEYTLLTGTTSAVVCGGGTPTVTYGGNISCVATVTRLSGANTPSGNVNWTSSESGAFGTSTCVQNTTAGTLTCTSDYTPSAVGTGSHLITATYPGDVNFSTSFGTQTVTVSPKAATVTADDKSKDYGDDNPALTATVNGTINGDTLNYTLATAAVKLSNVDVYPIQVTLGANPNYTVSSTNGVLTVNKKAATVTADAKSKAYGDDNPALTAIVTGEVVGGIPIDYTLATTAVKLSNVADYPITVSLGTNPNYNVTATDALLTVNKKDASVTADAKSKTYGNDNPDLTAAVVGQVAGGDAINYTLATTAVKLSSVGSYPITVTLGANPNYNVTVTDALLTVNKKDASVTAVAKSKAYGDDNPDLTAAVTGEVVGGDVISYTLATNAEKLSIVGSYPITVTLGTNPNYNVTATDGLLTVNKKDATITADAKSKAYGDDNPDLTAAVVGQVVGGDVISYALATNAVKLSVVGSYPITVTLGTNPNYTVTATDGLLTVNKKDATVTADTQSKAYGDDNPALSATVVGQVTGGDVISYTLATNAEKLSVVGSYPITVTLGTNPNYTVTPGNSTLTVNKKDATVTADNKTKTYGDDNPALTAAVVGQVSGGDVISYTLATTAVKLSNVDYYRIAVIPGANPNYTITATDGILSVTAKAATVTADAKSKAYGDDNPALSATVVGQVAGGDVISYTLATNAEKLSVVGSYPITVTLGTNPNYTVTPTNGLLTVNKKEATVTADNKSKTYRADNPALTATVVGQVSGGDVISYTLATNAEKLSVVGSYPITVTLGTNPNYTVTPTDGSLTVTKIPIVAAADNKSKVVGQPDPALTYQVTSGALLTGDAFTGALTRVPGEAAGSYAIQQGTLALPAYYDLTFVGATLTIQAASPALTLVKTATPQIFAKAGDVIQYSYVLTNSGNVPLAGPFTVADDKATDEACPATTSLAAGASLTCTASYTITLADVRVGSVTNTATAAGSYSDAVVTSNTAQATVTTYRLFLPVIHK